MGGGRRNKQVILSQSEGMVVNKLPGWYLVKPDPEIIGVVLFSVCLALLLFCGTIAKSNVFVSGSKDWHHSWHGQSGRVGSVGVGRCLESLFDDRSECSFQALEQG